MIQAYLKKQEQFQINNLTYYVEELGKEQTKSNIGRRKEIMKIRAEINKIKLLK